MCADFIVKTLLLLVACSCCVRRFLLSPLKRICDQNLDVTTQMAVQKNSLRDIMHKFLLAERTLSEEVLCHFVISCELKFLPRKVNTSLVRLYFYWFVCILSPHLLVSVLWRREKFLVQK